MSRPHRRGMFGVEERFIYRGGRLRHLFLLSSPIIRGTRKRAGRASGQNVNVGPGSVSTPQRRRGVTASRQGFTAICGGRVREDRPAAHFFGHRDESRYPRSRAVCTWCRLFARIHSLSASPVSPSSLESLSLHPVTAAISLPISAAACSR